MKKTLLLLSSFIAVNFSIDAQSITPDVLASGGNYFVGSGFTNSFTVGQGSLHQTFSTTGFILTQGFQQPYDGPTAVNVNSLNDHNIGTYPNPNNGHFELEYDLDADAEITIEVFDVLGQRVHSETSHQSSGHIKQPIELNDQPNGVYIVRCTINNNGRTTTLNQKFTLSR